MSLTPAGSTTWTTVSGSAGIPTGAPWVFTGGDADAELDPTDDREVAATRAKPASALEPDELAVDRGEPQPSASVIVTAAEKQSAVLESVTIASLAKEPRAENRRLPDSSTAWYARSRTLRANPKDHDQHGRDHQGKAHGPRPHRGGDGRARRGLAHVHQHENAKVIVRRENAVQQQHNRERVKTRADRGPNHVELRKKPCRRGARLQGKHEERKRQGGGGMTLPSPARSS